MTPKGIVTHWLRTTVVGLFNGSPHLIQSQTHFLWDPRIVQCLILYLGTSCTLEAGKSLFVQLQERFVEAKTCCGLFFPVTFRKCSVEANEMSEATEGTAGQRLLSGYHEASTLILQ